MAIHKKLLEFQKLGISLHKDGTNPHFKSSYVTLNEVLDKVKSPLNEMGVVIIQEPFIEGLKTTLYDTEDDTMVTCVMPYVEIATAQKLGSCNTYLRRYSLVTLLGLEDEDDDGNKASEKTPAKPAAKPVAKTPTPEEATQIALDRITNAKSIKELLEIDDKIRDSKIIPSDKKIDLAFELQEKILTFDPTE